MNRKKDGRPDVAASERPAEQISITPSSNCPRTYYTSGNIPRQEENLWDYEDEKRLVDFIIGPFIRSKYRRLPKYYRDLTYSAAMRKVNDYSLSPEANCYARRSLAEHLRL